MSIPISKLKKVMKPKYLKAFNNWVKKQTVEAFGNDEFGVYENDFVRWLMSLPVID